MTHNTAPGFNQYNTRPKFTTNNKAMGTEMLQWWCLWADHWRMLWQSALEKIRKWQQPRQSTGN